jgi:ankyrin repeat protein
VQRAIDIEAKVPTDEKVDGRTRRWYIIDHPCPLKKPDDHHPEVFHLFQTGRQIVGFRPTSDFDGETTLSDAEAQCANSATDWMRLNEMNNEAARVLHFRSRLAYLTGEPVTPTDQGWDTKIREMSRQLQHALQDSADYIFSAGMQLSSDWRNTKALIWSTTCQLSDLSTNPPIFPIHFLMYQDNGRWKISVYQLESALGLWWWSLKQLPKERQVFTRKVMFAEGSKNMEYKAAIRFWVTQAGMTNERIQLLSPTSLNSSRFHSFRASPSGESDHHTSPSIPMTTSLDFLGLKEDESGMGPGNGVLAIQSRSSPLQMIAQDIFTIFISRIADIMEPLKDAVPRQSQFDTTNLLDKPQERPYLGLMNAHVESITDKVVAAGIATRQDALMSIIPPLLQRSKLPQLDSVMEDLLSYAKSLRRDRRYQVGEGLLKGLLHLGPSQYQGRVMRALGELYRAAIRSLNQPEQDFGARGFEEMEKTCDIPKLPAKVKDILDHYKSVWQYFKKRSSTQGDQRTRTLNGDPEDLLKNLMSESARTRGLTLTEDIDLSDANSAYLLKILQWAIEQNSPELIEDLWAVKRELIHKTDEQDRTPIFWAIEIGCDADTFQALLEWPTARPDTQDKEGKTPLLLAAETGRCKAVDFLLKLGSNSLAKDHGGNTALALAIENSNDDVVKRLLDARVEVNEQGGMCGSALAAAAYGRKTEIVKSLVQEGKADVNMQLQGGDYGSALAAACMGDTGIVKFLVQEGKADVDMQLKSGNYGSALVAAAHGGDTEIVKFLVQEGKADVNMQPQSGNYGSALAAAIYGGNTDIVKFLVQEGKADVNMQIQSGTYGSALATAAGMGNTKIIKFLVQEGKADVNMQLQGENYSSALEVAVCEGDAEIVKFLVQEGKADVNMQLQGGDYSSAVAAAAYRRKTEFYKSLLQEGKTKLNMQLQSGDYGSALAAAAYWGHIEIVQFLVQEGKAGVNMQLQSGNYGSALAAAACWGHIEIVQFLVREGKADVNMQLQSGNYGSALAAAAYKGETKTIEFLVQEGKADVSMQLQGGDYGSALAAAAYGRKTEIVKSLVQEGKADINMQLQSGNYGSALAAATYGEDTEIVKFLVQEGKADVNMQLKSGNYGSALAAAAGMGNTKIIKFLVQEGKADVNMQLQSGNYSSALEVAADRGDAEIVKFLVQEGKADVNMQLQNGNYGSALVAAAHKGDTEIVKFLVQEGKADVNMQLQGGDYGSALAAAIYGKNTEIVKFLVQEGKADVNMQFQTGDFSNVLAVAAHFSWGECVEILISAGAVVDHELENTQLGRSLGRRRVYIY